ncbi:MAG TPA: MerR family transcriptional regulator [Nocardioidaceae bacterium]|jgi:MerR family transcriptional regulator/heat shock protein HspR
MAADDPKDRSDSPLSPLDDSSMPFYTIGQVASLLGIQPAVLRRLDEQDIVRPGRSEGGQRRYSKDDVERLNEVLDLTEEGVTLPGVRKVLALRERVSHLEDEIAQMKAEKG